MGGRESILDKEIAKRGELLGESFITLCFAFVKPRIFHQHHAAGLD